MEQQAFIENARSLGTIQLTDRIKEVKKRLDYLLNNHLFTQEDLELNSMTVTWPKRIQPIFDRNDEVSTLRIIIPGLNFLGNHICLSNLRIFLYFLTLSLSFMAPHTE